MLPPAGMPGNRRELEPLAVHGREGRCARGTFLGLVLGTAAWAANDAGTRSAPMELLRNMPFVPVLDLVSAPRPSRR